MPPETKYAGRVDVHVAHEFWVRARSTSRSSQGGSCTSRGGGSSRRGAVPPAFVLLQSSISFDKYGIGLSDPAPPGSLPPLEEWMDGVRRVMDAASSERAAILGAGEGCRCV
jgi:hypothetical protein